MVTATLTRGLTDSFRGLVHYFHVYGAGEGAESLYPDLQAEEATVSHQPQLEQKGPQSPPPQ